MSRRLGRLGPVLGLMVAVRVAAGEPSRRGDYRDIQDTIMAHRMEVKRCVDAEKARSPGSHAQLSLRWRIQPDGSVTDVEPTTDALKGTPVVECLSRVIASLSFGAGGAQEVGDYPFKW